LEHNEHLARDEARQQCHCRLLVQEAAVTRRPEVSDECHQPQKGVARELPRGLHQGPEVRADAVNGVASRELQAETTLCKLVPIRRKERSKAVVDNCVFPPLPLEGEQRLLHPGALRALVGVARLSLTVSCALAASGGSGGF